MARPKLTAAEHLANGTYRPSRHGPLGSSAPTAGASPPRKPTDLKGEAAKVWRELLALLVDVVEERDGPQLADACRWIARGREIDAALENVPPTDDNFPRLVRLANMCAARVSKILQKFGMTPADRARLPQASGPPVARVPSKPKTKFDVMGKALLGTSPGSNHAEV